MTIEKLTEADRDRLDQKGERKALRIIDAQAEWIAALERRAAAWERGHDYAWSEKQRAETELSALRAGLAPSTPRAAALQCHGLDPAEIEVDAMFEERPCGDCGAPTSNWHQTSLDQERMFLCLLCERLGGDYEPECRAARHGHDSTCTCEDSRDE